MKTFKLGLLIYFDDVVIFSNSNPFLTLLVNDVFVETTVRRFPIKMKDMI